MRRLLLAISVVGLLAAACGDDDDPGVAADDTPTSVDDDTTTDTADDNATADAAEDISGTGEIEIGLGDFAFSPASLRGSAGQELEVTLTNRGAVPHTFTSDALGVDEQLDPGASTTVTLALPGDGTAAFFCRFHQSQGMEGAFLVDGADPVDSSTTEATTGATPDY